MIRQISNRENIIPIGSLVTVKLQERVCDGSMMFSYIAQGIVLESWRTPSGNTSLYLYVLQIDDKPITSILSKSRRTPYSNLLPRVCFVSTSRGDRILSRKSVNTTTYSVDSAPHHETVEVKLLPENAYCQSMLKTIKGSITTEYYPVDSTDYLVMVRSRLGSPVESISVVLNDTFPPRPLDQLRAQAYYETEKDLIEKDLKRRLKK